MGLEQQIDPQALIDGWLVHEAARHGIVLYNRIPIVMQVIFNDPATIVYFHDGDKIVVKTKNGEEFQPEVGVAMAVMKKLFGSRAQYKKFIKDWLECGA